MAVRDYIAKYVADLTGYRLEPAVQDTEELERAQEDLARSTGLAADRVAREWQGMARDVDYSGEKIERSVDEVDRDTRGKLAGTGREAGSEFVQNLGESISSGDLSSIANDTAGGLAATFGTAGPIGAAFAGIALLGSQVFGGMQRRAEQIREATSSLFDDMINAADRESRFRNQVTGLFGDFQTGIDTIARLSEKTGVPMKDIADALTGGARAAGRLGEQIREQIPLVDKQLQNTRGIPRAQLDAIQNGKELLALLRDSAGVQQAAADSASAYASAIDDGTEAWKRFGEARARALDNRRTLADFDPGYAGMPKSGGRRE